MQVDAPSDETGRLMKPMTRDEALRRLGLAGTELAGARCQAIRLKPLKIGALVRVTVRKVWVSLSGAYPYAALFARVLANLEAGCT